MNMTNGNVPKQVQHENYRQALVQSHFIRHGAEVIIVTPMHEELTTVMPQEARLVMDIDLVLTLSSAKGLIKDLQQHIEQMEAAVEVVKKDEVVRRR